MGKKAIGKAVGPFDVYTEILVDRVGTVGIPANCVCKVMEDEETGKIDLEFTKASKDAKKAPKKK